MALEQEVDYFESIKPELLKHHEGKFALIKGRELIDTFTKEEEAYETGVNRFGTEPFLIKRISKEDPPEKLPALMMGTLRAGL